MSKSNHESSKPWPRHLVKFPIFGAEMRLYIGEDNHPRFVKEASAAFPDTLFEELEPHVQGACYGSFIWLREMFPMSAENMKYLVHESSHSVDCFLGHYGIEDTETRAYLHGYAIEQLLEKAGAEYCRRENEQQAAAVEKTQKAKKSAKRKGKK